MKRKILVISVLVLVISAVMYGNLWSGEQSFIILLGQDTAFDREKPLVRFDHDRHLQKSSKDCSQCHYTKGPDVCLLTKGAEIKDKRDYMNAYHDLCIPCHKAKENTGPLTCGGCHDQGLEQTHRPFKAAFKHSDHADLLQTNAGCMRCHKHVNQPVLRDVQACFVCHDKKTDLQQTAQHEAHMRCFKCHFEKKERNDISCSSCHQAGFIKPATIMPATVFDHDLHQDVSGCKDCHILHEHSGKHYKSAREGCLNCHEKLTDKTLFEKEKIQSFALFHSQDVTFGCVGCHINLDSGPEYKNCKECHAGE